MAEWEGYILPDYEIRFAAASLVLDVGCARGNQMTALIAQGSSVIGID